MYTEEEVIQIIDRILQHPDNVIDAVTVENSAWDANALFELGRPKSICDTLVGTLPDGDFKCGQIKVPVESITFNKP